MTLEAILDALLRMFSLASSSLRTRLASSSGEIIVAMLSLMDSLLESSLPVLSINILTVVCVWLEVHYNIV